MVCIILCSLYIVFMYMIMWCFSQMIYSDWISAIVGCPRRPRSVSAWFFHVPFLSRGSHYCGGQSRAGASTLSHTPGRTNRKTQWHVTVLLAVLPQRRMHYSTDECMPTTTTNASRWRQLHEFRRMTALLQRRMHEWIQTTVTSSSK